MNDTLHPFIRYRESQKPPMTQAALGRLLGVSRSCINRIESGNRLIGIDMLATAAKRTGLPLAVLRPDLQSLWKIRRTKRGRR